MSIHEQPHETIRRLQSQLAAETMRAGEYQQERDRALDLATEMRKRAERSEADRDRLREAISRVEDWMHDDRAGMPVLAEIIQSATGEAAIAPPHPHHRDICGRCGASWGEKAKCPKCHLCTECCVCSSVGKAAPQENTQ